MGSNFEAGVVLNLPLIPVNGALHMTYSVLFPDTLLMFVCSGVGLSFHAGKGFST